MVCRDYDQLSSAGRGHSTSGSPGALGTAASHPLSLEISQQALRWLTCLQCSDAAIQCTTCMSLSWVLQGRRSPLANGYHGIDLDLKQAAEDSLKSAKQRMADSGFRVSAPRSSTPVPSDNRHQAPAAAPAGNGTAPHTRTDALPDRYIGLSHTLSHQPSLLGPHIKIC